MKKIIVFAIIGLIILPITKTEKIDNGLQSSPWPMFHHDLRHTGRSEYDTSKNPGTLKWKANITHLSVGGTPSSPAIGKDGTIYVGSGAGMFYAINPDGSLKWKFNTSFGIILSSPAIGEDGTIYFGASNGFYALNPDGTLKWKAEISVYVSSPAIGKDGTIYIGDTTTEDFIPRGRIRAFYPNGTQKWEFKTDHWIYSSPAIGEDGTIYIGSDDNYLYALNPDGTLKWKFKTYDNIHSSPSIAEDGTIYFGSWDCYFYALNPDGTLKWKYVTGVWGYSINGCSPAIAEDGTVYVGSWDNCLYAFYPNGTLKWKFSANNHIDSSPAIGKDGTIYFGSYDSYLYALNPDGTLKWKFKTNDWIASSPAIGKDGTIYFAGYDGYLYAIGGIKIEKPKEGFLYINDREISPTIFGNTLIIGKITVDVYAFNEENVDRIEFYLDGRLIAIDKQAPFEILLDETAIWKHKLEIYAIYKECIVKEEMILIIFNIFILFYIAYG